MEERDASRWEVQAERMILLRVKEWICIIILVLISPRMERSTYNINIVKKYEVQIHGC